MITIGGDSGEQFVRRGNTFAPAGYPYLIAENAPMGTPLMGDKERNDERLHETPAGGFPFRRSSPNRAADCSASFLVLPEPVPKHSSPIKTSTMKSRS